MKETVVISGISGRFPRCDNIDEFRDALLNHVDLITEHDRYNHEVETVSPRMGLLNSLDQFDSQFFNAQPWMFGITEGRRRITTEVVYEALMDAGYNPEELRDSNTAVFLSVNPPNKWYNEQPGSLIANGISYSLNLRGPSLGMDAACAGSFYAINAGYYSILTGQCTRAIAAAVQFQLSPYETNTQSLILPVSTDGGSRIFNYERYGFVKAEASVAVLLEKGSMAKRIYCTIEGVGVDVDGYKMEGIFVPSSEKQLNLFETIFEKFQIDKNDVEYIEAHGTGTKTGDAAEVKAIAEFNKNRKGVLIGSVKSNMGHSEVASGLCGLIKAIIAMQTGLIPANLNFVKPSEDLVGIVDGTLKVVDQNTPYHGGLIALNAFGFGGTNSHLVVRPFTKLQLHKPLSETRLILVASRTEEGLKTLQERIVKEQDNAEFLALIEEIHKTRIAKYYHRGYVILQKEPEIIQSTTDGRQKPIWFVYCGVGSQWPGMAKDLMEFKVFRESLEICCDIIKPYGIDLKNVLINGTTETFNDPFNSFTAIAAMSICLTDLLLSLKIEPDGFIGHSLGEIGCSYADGCLTRREAILLGYARALGTAKGQVISGLMASIGLSLEECTEILPEDIDIAAHNAPDNVTISGPKETVEKFVKSMQSRGVFAKIVNTMQLPLHSRYLSEAGKIFLEFTKSVIVSPKRRSEKWLSSTFPQNEWDSDIAKYCSHEYHYQNFVGKVNFSQLLSQIPEDAIVIEVGAKGLLQAFLRRHLSPKTKKIAIMSDTANNNHNYILNSIGQIYIAGGQPDLSSLNKPLVNFPLGVSAPTISPLIAWDHSIPWHVPTYKENLPISHRFTIDMTKQENMFLSGHVVDNKNLLPATNYLLLVWQAYSKILQIYYQKLPVVFENVKLFRATLLSPNSKINLTINILKSGNFEIIEDDAIIVTGKIYSPTNIEKEFLQLPYPEIEKSDYLRLNSHDVYTELHIRGLEYSDLFKGIIDMDNSGADINLVWNDNWVTFIDTMIQGIQFRHPDRQLYISTMIERIVIDPVKHLEIAKCGQVEFKYNVNLNAAKAGGIEIVNLNTTKILRHSTKMNVPLERYEFVDYENSHNLDDVSKETIIYTCLQIVRESAVDKLEITIGELLLENSEDNYFKTVKNVTDKMVCKQNYLQLPLSEIEENTTKFDVVLVKDIKQVGVTKLVNLAKFVFLEIDESYDFSILQLLGLIPIFKHQGYVLLKRKINITENLINSSIIINVDNQDWSWVEDLKLAMAKAIQNRTLIYLTSYEMNSGIIGLFNCLRLEDGGDLLRAYLTPGQEKFSFKSDFYGEQLKKDIFMNVFKHGKWGTYIYLPTSDLLTKISDNSAIAILNPGDFKSLTWMENNSKIQPEDVVIKVAYSALNLRDEMIAKGKLLPTNSDDQPELGCEYSGIDCKGRRVMGLVSRGALSKKVVAQPGFVWEVPPNWTLEEAATVPLAYYSNYLGLLVEGKLKKDESILVHDGTHPTGLAAIHIALQMGCTVFATVDTNEKKEYLKKYFPKISDSRIGHSQDKTFQEFIMHETKGKGVDLIVNVKTRDNLQTLLKCVSPKGRLIDYSVKELPNNPSADTSPAFNNISYHNIDIQYHLENKKLNAAILKDFQSWLPSVKPLQYHIFENDQIEDAFKNFNNDKYIGKILISFDNEASKPILSTPQTFFNPEKSYIIIGGLGGAGLEVVNWMINRGARIIFLNSRGHVKTGYQSYCIRRWRENGAVIEISTDNCCTREGAKSLIQKAAKLGPIGGIFSTALVVKDGYIESQTKDNFEAVMASKKKVTEFMDQLSRELCPKLDYFVMFSSVAAGLGNFTQSNYGQANSAVEMICEQRHKDGLPALALEYAPIGQVGIVARTGDESVQLFLNRFYVNKQNIHSCLKQLDRAIQQRRPILSCCPIKDKDMAMAQKENIMDTLKNIFSIKDIDKVEDSIFLQELGMDSLVASEIKFLLSRNHSVELKVNDVMKLTIGEIRNIQKMKGSKK